MTMRIKITNEDTTRAAKVVLNNIAADGTRQEAVGAGATLQPNESRDFYVHSTAELLVQESDYAAAAPPDKASE